MEYPNGGVSRFYDNDIDMVIIDENICVCEDKKSYFRYMLITDKQNNYMHMFRRLFRFLGYVQEEVDRYLYSDEITMSADHFIKIGDRSEQADVSPLELHFEQSFSNTYGIHACAFENRIEDDIKQYFGKDTSDFIDNGIKIDRPFELYEHQVISLQEIKKRREAGIKAFLVVLPTASGKSKIVEEDLKEFSKDKTDFRALILVPGINISADWEERIKKSLPELKDKIDIRTYAYMARHYTDYPADYYRYLVVDETKGTGLIQRYA